MINICDLEYEKEYWSYWSIAYDRYKFLIDHANWWFMSAIEEGA